MKEFITKNFQFLIIVALFIVLMLQRCGGDGGKNQTIVKRDTVVSVIYHYYNDTTKSVPIIVNAILPKQNEIPVSMKPDGTYIDLKRKYDSLLLIHYTKNIQIDSTKIDTFGYVKTKDTVYNNRIIGRQWINNLKIPEKTNTVTVTQILPSKTHIYLGFSLSGTQNTLINGGGIGGLLINKKQQVYGIDVKLMNHIGTVYEGRTYWDLDRILKGK